LCAEILHECLSGSDCSYRLAGLDIVETNPLVDSHNETAKMGVEWVASLFGKTILGKR
jgi:arginase family enzyme